MGALLVMPGVTRSQLFRRRGLDLHYEFWKILVTDRRNESRLLLRENRGNFSIFDQSDIRAGHQRFQSRHYPVKANEDDDSDAGDLVQQLGNFSRSRDHRVVAGGYFVIVIYPFRL
jgi:hypothetical protein